MGEHFRSGVKISLTKIGQLAIYYLIAIGSMVWCGCQTDPHAGESSILVSLENTIPKPVQVLHADSAFSIFPETKIWADSALYPVGEYLVEILHGVFGDSSQIVLSSGSEPQVGDIQLRLVNEDSLGTEGYKLSIDAQELSLSANSPSGIFYGIQTLRQAIMTKSATPGKSYLTLKGNVIVDRPRYGYRSAMLDVSRHFFGVDDVKRFIDLISLYKLNYLHLHLSDDQGWRIEIKSWPKLATHGGSTQVGGGQGGYYTQEQYRELVAYAAHRFITIVPEIDLPGHTQAALASYGELSCNGKIRELYTGTEVGFSTLCPTKKIVLEFVDDVVGELAKLTPGPYIHIGGDEAHSTQKKDYLYFINHFKHIVEKHGKKMIGWEEIAQADIDSNTVFQKWRIEPEMLKLGMQKGALVILSPASKTYLDMKYDSTTALGLHWAGYIEVQDAYQWEPDEYINGNAPSQVLGVECPLWTETIETMDDIEYMVFPRLPAVAELAWTPKENRKWEDFKLRLVEHGELFTLLEVDFYPSPQIPWSK